MTYRNICKCLDGYWEKSWSELPDEQRQAWREALGPLGDDTDNDGRLWDGQGAKGRKYVAEIHDIQHDPALEGVRHVAWCDTTIKARTWFDTPDVLPREAAMVLCRLDPLERDWRGEPPDPERINVDDDKSSPKRYRLLLAMFESVARSSPKHRTLMEWRAIAQEKGLRYHEWIDKYVAAIGADGGGPSALQVSGTAPATDAAHSGASENNKEWLPEAKRLASEYIGAWRAAGYEPTKKDAALYVEGEFSTRKIYGKRKEVLDSAYIERWALTGITDNKPGYKGKKKKIPDGMRGKLPCTK